jgi:hypothetical protein
MYDNDTDVMNQDEGSNVRTRNEDMKTLASSPSEDDPTKLLEETGSENHGGIEEAEAHFIQYIKY